MTVSVGDKFYNKTYDTELEVVYISEYNQIVLKYDDGSIVFYEDTDYLKQDGLKLVEEKVDGWLTVVRDPSFGVYFLDVVHVTKENARNAFYRNSENREYELVGFQYVEWDGDNEN